MLCCVPLVGVGLGIRLPLVWVGCCLWVGLDEFLWVVVSLRLVLVVMCLGLLVILGGGLCGICSYLLKCWLLVTFDLGVAYLVVCVYGLPGLFSGCLVWLRCWLRLLLCVLVVFFVLSVLVVGCLGVLVFGDLRAFGF